MQTRREIKLDGINSQVLFLEAARNRNLLWAAETEDNEIENLHLEIAGLMQQTREKYRTLLEKYYHIF